MLVLEKLVIIENASLKTAQTMVIKYMYNGQLYMLGVLLFFCLLNSMCSLIIFLYISINDMCGYRYMVCPAITSYSFGATALIFDMMFIHIMEVCMSTGF